MCAQFTSPTSHVDVLQMKMTQLYKQKKKEKTQFTVYYSLTGLINKINYIYKHITAFAIVEYNYIYILRSN